MPEGCGIRAVERGLIALRYQITALIHEVHERGPIGLNGRIRLPYQRDGDRVTRLDSLGGEIVSQQRDPFANACPNGACDIVCPGLARTDRRSIQQYQSCRLGRALDGESFSIL
jgi:hypothetical protein